MDTIKQPLVSISCITYNHEKYIERAIKSFLEQKTEFVYEILIHDDASTDDTQRIIKKFEKKYPEIIKPIYQTENHYAKGEKITFNFNFPRARGKYIALCEGDDFWIDEYKLQKQVKILEKNPQISQCFHKVKIINAEGKELGGILPEKKWSKNVNKTIDILLKNYIPTPSIMFRNNRLDKEECLKLSTGLFFSDWVISFLNSLYGDIYFIDEVMAAYRITNEGTNSKTPLETRAKSIFLFYDRVMDYFHDENMIQYIRKCKSDQALGISKMALSIKEYKFAKECFNISNEHGKISIKNKMNFLFQYKFPKLYPKAKELQKKIRKTINV